MSCIVEPIYVYVLGISLCVGGIISYLPQYYALIKTKQAKGISELSLFILNIGSVCLAINSVILNWSKFDCYQSQSSHHGDYQGNYHYGDSGENCPMWICGFNLLPTIQIVIGWLMVFLLHLIFVRYKIKNSEKALIYDLAYIIILCLFMLIVGTVALTEKFRKLNISLLLVPGF